MGIFVNCICLVCTVVILCVFVVSYCVFVVPYMYLLYLMCICCTMCVLPFLLLDAGLLALSQYPEGPATGHLDTPRAEIASKILDWRHLSKLKGTYTDAQVFLGFPVSTSEC